VAHLRLKRRDHFLLELLQVVVALAPLPLMQS
jgi:hypothetical protein